VTELDFYRSKIQAYLDGILKPVEVSEFEAYALTHHSFMTEVKQRQKDLLELQELIPEFKLDKEKYEELSNEVVMVMKDIIKPESKKITSKLSFFFKEIF
jgi:hypothetical protein